MQLRGLAFLPLLGLMACGVQTGEETNATSDEIQSRTLATASQLPEHCSGPEMKRIERPVDKDDAESGTYSYAFRFRGPTEPGAPVVVYLPGGPGSPSTFEKPELIPEGWGYLLTDPRGVGCNTLAALPPESISGEFHKTEEIAADVIAAIQSQHIDDYVLFGISYGTLLGTVVVHEIEASKMTPPRAVVLEGVLGRAFTGEFMAQESIRQWDRVRGVLPADVLEELDTKDEPYGIPSVVWSHALTAALPSSPVDAANLVAALSTTLGLTDEQREQARQQILAMGSVDEERVAPGAIELYRQVACREIADTVPASDLDVVFDHGKLVRNLAEEGTKCRGLRLTTPFDSADYQFSSKVYYFVGEDDVATPAWQGAYHFEHHEGPAMEIVTLGGGHNPLQYNQAECAHDVMRSIASGGADLANVLSTCPQETRVRTH